MKVWSSLITFLCNFLKQMEFLVKFDAKNRIFDWLLSKNVYNDVLCNDTIAYTRPITTSSLLRLQSVQVLSAYVSTSSDVSWSAQNVKRDKGVYSLSHLTKSGHSSYYSHRRHKPTGWHWPMIWPRRSFWARDLILRDWPSLLFMGLSILQRALLLWMSKMHCYTR